MYKSYKTGTDKIRSEHIRGMVGTLPLLEHKVKEHKVIGHVRPMPI